uniref:Calcium binding and coiled-coil domain 1 n=1 Tax=Callorhinchus milii TaxID=7868 RepID=C7B9E6_CALMI|nr:calcium binding and coiled-coil domain 1 [Callorhinchus milii]
MEALPKSQSQPKVTFHNVASLYIPGTSVECHYSLAPHARWTSKDWIGIFKVRWSSVRDYHTFLWSPSPDGYAEGSPTNCSVRFQASYLPRSGPTLYQFCYVEFKGEVAGVSTPFTFSDPKPEEDFITLEDFENNSDMLVVMTKTSLLERQLEESDRTKESLVARQRHLEGEMQQLQGKIEELEQALEIAIAEQTRLNQETHSLEEEKQRVTTQHISLEQEHAQAIDRIQELEEDIQALSGTVLEKESELERYRCELRSHSEASQLEVQRLQGEQQVLRNALADTDSLVTELRDEVEDLQQKASAAHELKGQVDILREQLRCTHDQLAASQQKVVLMGEEMGSASSTRDRTMSELHRSRLDVADLNIRLAEVTVKWKESKGQWLKEKAIFLQSSEAEKERVLKLSVELVKVKSSLQEQESEAENLRLELIRERDCSRVQLSELLRERKEMKSGFRVVEKEKEKLQEEKQELLEYVKVLEARLEQIPGPNDSDATYKEASAITEVADGAEDVECAPITPSEGRGRPRLSSYSLCDNTNSQDSLTFNTPPLSPQELNSQVVISQPMAISPQHNPAPHDSSSESEDEEAGGVYSEATPSQSDGLNALLTELGHTLHFEVR